MAFQILYPFPMTIDADSFKDAAKKFVKMNHNLNIANLIMADRLNHLRKVNIRRFVQGGKHKASLTILPFHQPLVGFSSKDPDTKYPAPLIALPDTFGKTYLAPTVKDNTFLHEPRILRQVVPHIPQPVAVGMPVGGLYLNTVGMGPIPNIN